MCAIFWSKSFLFLVQISRHLLMQMWKHMFLRGTQSVSGNKGRQSFFFTQISQATGDSGVIFVFRLCSTVLGQCTFSLSVVEIEHWAAVYQSRRNNFKHSHFSLLLLFNRIVMPPFSCFSLCSWMISILTVHQYLWTSFWVRINSSIQGHIFHCLPACDYYEVICHVQIPNLHWCHISMLLLFLLFFPLLLHLEMLVVDSWIYQSLKEIFQSLLSVAPFVLHWR